MYSPSRGDARATATPNARDLSSSMPIDHVPTWHREPYSSSSRDVRIDRGDRSERGVTGKRDWNNSDRTSSSSTAPFQRSLGLHPANNGISLGPPNKRRAQGRHNSFYTEIGHYSAAASREGDTTPLFGDAIQPLENGLGRKYERDSFYSGTGAPPPLSPSLNGALGVVGQWHTSSRESGLSTSDGRDTVSSCTVTGQNGRPYQSQAHLDEDNLSWDRERSTGAVSGWEWSLKSEREQQHRERLHGKPELYTRRFDVPLPSQFDAGRAWSAGDTQLEGSRVDRYGSGNRESFSLDIVTGSKDSSSHGSHDWRSWGERSTSGIVPRGSPFITSNGSLKDTVVRGHGLEVDTGGLSSPLPSPHSALPSGGHDQGHGRSHRSPPKRLRLGWGQGLAKYEKKKVGDVDESSLVSGGVGTTVSVSLPGASSGSDNPPPSPEQTNIKETALSSVAKSPAQPTCDMSLPPPVQPVDMVVGTPEVSVEQNVIRKQKHDLLLGEAEGSVNICGTETEKAMEEVSVQADNCVLLEVPSDQADPLKAADIVLLAINVESKDSSSVEVSTCKQPVTTAGPVLIEPETLPEGDGAAWSKEGILQRVEKVEFEIDQIEKEVARLAVEGNGEILQDFPGNVSPLEAEVKKNQLKVTEDNNSIVHIRETLTLPLCPSPASPFSPAAEDTSGNSVNYKEVGLVEMMADVPDMKVEEKAVRLEYVEGDVAAPLEEGFEKKDDVRSQQGEELCVKSPHGLACGTETRYAQVSMKHVVNVTQSGMDDEQELSTMVLVEDFQNFTDSLMMENKKQSRCALDSLVHLLTKELVQEGKGQLYCTPVESPMWQKNVETHHMNLDRMVEKLTEQRHCLKFKEQVLTMRFRILKDAWRQEQLRLDQRRYRAKPIRRWEIERRNGTAPPSQRSSLRLHPIQSGLGRADEELHAMKLMCEPPVEQLRSVQKMPSMILDDKERLFRRFINTNALVEDPVLLELERKAANPWLPEEKKIFIDKFAIYNKNFSKIAGHLEHKTTADCVEFYYQNHKSEDFEKIRRRHQLKKRRDYSQASASYLATTTPGSSRHRDSNAARVEALNKAAAAAAAAISGITAGTKAVRSSIHSRVVDRTRMSMPAVHPASLLSVLDNINKTNGMKDNKAATSNASSVTVAAVPPPSTNCTAHCGLSSAAPPVVKHCRERNPLKNLSVSGLSMSRSFQLEQLTLGSKGARSMHLRQESSKSPVEERDVQWTDSERHLFTDAVGLYGKDFENIALHVGSKSEVQCKAFFSKTRKRLGLDQIVEQYQAGVDGTAGTALPLQDLELTQGHSDGTKAVVTEDAKACHSNSKSAASSIKGETAEGVAVEVKIPKPESVDEETAGTADKLELKTHEGLAETVGEHSVHESIEDTALLTAAVEDVSEVAAQVTVVGEAVVLEESSISKPEASTSTSFITGCPLLEPAEQALKVEQCEEVCATESNAKVPGFSVSGMPNDERESKSTKVDVLLPLSTMDKETVMEQAAATLEKSSKATAEWEELKVIQNIDVKPEPESPQVATSANTDSCCLPPLARLAAQSTSVVLSATVPIHSAQQFKEKPGRAGAGGDTKPRREPTSWTQEEKDKFSEIIRKHGKDWTRLHECLPAKSLTQIKTYFQNSKAKLGLVPSDGVVNSAGRGIGSRKRKADDSDTSSNNVGSVVAPINQQKAGTLLPPDVEIASQKVNPVMVPLPSMGTNAAGSDHLTFPLLAGQKIGQAIDQDSMSIQKLIQQMCSTNGFPPNTPSSMFPFLHHSGLPIFPASGLQRAQHLQQLATSASQKQPLQSMIHQKLPAQSTGLVQQNNPPVLHQQAAHQQMQQTAQVVARNQQQLLQNQVVSIMQQAALRQQQQQKTPQVVVHPLQQQVVGLQQQQQQQLLLNQHVHHQQPQATSQQQQQVGMNLTQQVSTQGQQENNPPQQVVGQQQQHLHHQQQKVLLQQQQMQQAVQQYHQHQQLQQQQQQQDQALAQVQAHMQAQVLALAQAQAQAQAQAHVQAQAQAHVQAQVQAQAHVQAQAQAAAAQVHAHVQEREQASQHPALTQQLRKPLTKITLQQEQQKSLTKAALQQQQQQQGGGLHHHDQQHGQSLALLRGSLQALTPSSVTELSNQQVDIREAKLRHLCQEDLQNQLSAVVQQATSTQQQQAAQSPRPSPSSTVDAQQQIRPGDIKLFGQSLLSQPSLNVAPQSALHQSASGVNDRVALHQPVYPTLSAPSSTVTKPSGTPAFGRVQAPPFMMPEGRQASWPTLGKHAGNMGLWNTMNGLQGATTLTKSNERETRSHAMQESMPHINDCFAQDSRELEGEQAMGAPPLHLKHLEQLCSMQELRRNEGLGKMVPASDQLGGGGAGPSVVGVGDVNQDSRIDNDKRSDHSQGLTSTGQIDCYKRSDLPQGLSGANRIDGEGRNELSQGVNGANQLDDERRNELSQGLSDPLMGSSNRAMSESTGMQGAPSVTSSQQMPRTVMDALMAIADWQNSRSLPGHAPSGSMPQQSLEQLQLWEKFFRREGSGASESVKTNSVFGLPASLGATAHLSGPEVLQQCVRDSSMYFTPQHMLSLAGQRVNNAGAWNNGTRLMHATESQLQIPMLPAISPFHSCPMSRGTTTATDEHLRPVDSRGPDSTTGGVS